MSRQLPLVECRRRPALWAGLPVSAAAAIGRL